jgi:hypothetical protein
MRTLREKRLVWSVILNWISENQIVKRLVWSIILNWISENQIVKRLVWSVILNGISENLIVNACWTSQVAHTVSLCYKAFGLSYSEFHNDVNNITSVKKLHQGDTENWLSTLCTQVLLCILYIRIAFVFRDGTNNLVAKLWACSISFVLYFCGKMDYASI